MNDDINVAFGSLEERSIATGVGAPLDRICVRDFIKNIEIGAFQAERDTKQRIRFNVVLEVADSSAADFDDVDQVLSYDAITEAIEEQLSVERLNLLETLAERIADSILAHPRAMRVFVRIEKLDRIPGTLGIDIVRSKGVDQIVGATSYGIDPLIVFMPNSVLYGLELSLWLDVIETHDRPAIICLQAVKEQVPTTNAATSDLRIGLMSIEQNAWVLAAKDPRCVVVNNRTELDWAMKNGQLSVWAPTKIVLDAVDQPQAGPNNPLALTQWFAKEFFAGQVTVIQGLDRLTPTDRLLLAATPADL
ncbi:MAG: dihydroneopterin aldolase [Amylibacter sp.]|nr:dihydroneopterin aldolase [Amylibacter sp.]